MTAKKTDISIIIVTLNEDQYIAVLISHLAEMLPDSYSHEITVVDNGSTDGTHALVEKTGAALVISTELTVAGLRNLGAQKSRGEILMFMDADIALTDEWGLRIPVVIDKLKKNPMIVTGSICGVSGADNWLEKYWFLPLTLSETKYMNSGHLITTRVLFDSIKGFDDSLETMEDVDFSARAKRVGARIINDINLTVVHKRYPKTLTHFIRREIWHGRGTYSSLSTITKNKTALISIIYLLLHITLALSVSLRHYGCAGLSLIFILTLCIVAAATKIKKNLPVSSFIFYFYFMGRSIAFLRKIFGGVLLGNGRKEKLR